MCATPQRRERSVQSWRRSPGGDTLLNRYGRPPPVGAAKYLPETQPTNPTGPYVMPTRVCPQHKGRGATPGGVLVPAAALSALLASPRCQMRVQAQGYARKALHHHKCHPSHPNHTLLSAKM